MVDEVDARPHKHSHPPTRTARAPTLPGTRFPLPALLGELLPLLLLRLRANARVETRRVSCVVAAPRRVTRRPARRSGPPTRRHETFPKILNGWGAGRERTIRAALMRFWRISSSQGRQAVITSEHVSWSSCCRKHMVTASKGFQQRCESADRLRGRAGTARGAQRDRRATQ